MHIDELLRIAVANAGEDRVSIDSVEGAEISAGTVSGLAQLVAELVDNAVAFSQPNDLVEVSGRFVGSDYVVSVADHGVGMSDHLINALNHVLEDPRVHVGGPEPKLGIQLVARLAIRHGISVELIDTRPGTTARATVPARSVAGTPVAETKSVFSDVSPRAREMVPFGAPRPVQLEGVGRTIDLTKYESSKELEDQPTVSDSEVERFLESVFAPLRGQAGISELPVGSQPAQVSARRDAGGRAALQIRVPGENFSVSDDERSIAAGEGAVDIRRALSSYDDGRRSAADSDPDN